MLHSIKVPMLALALTSLFGCASNNGLSSDSKMAESIIANQVSVAADAQRSYAALLAEDARISYQKNEELNVDVIDVDYIGKPLPLLRGFASRYGYNFVEIGKKRDLRIVNVRMKSTNPEEVMRSIAHQIDYAGDLVLDKNTRVIRLVYKN